MIRRRAMLAVLVAAIALASTGCELLPTVAGGARGHAGKLDRVQCLLPEGCKGEGSDGGR